MEDLAAYAIDHARGQGATYVDVRSEEHYNELVMVMSGKIVGAVKNLDCMIIFC